MRYNFKININFTKAVSADTEEKARNIALVEMRDEFGLEVEEDEMVLISE